MRVMQRLGPRADDDHWPATPLVEIENKPCAAYSLLIVEWLTL
jgi:hypothetical protein